MLTASATKTQAATSTWSGNVDTSWSIAGNWDTAPAGGEDILFPNVTGQTVDLGAANNSIGTLTFNAPDAYSVANGTLTLGGDVTQSGAGAVALDSTTDLGGASRVFNGPGSGVVTLNGAVTDAAASGARAYFNGGNYVIANSANTIDRFVVTNGAKVTVVGSVASVPDYPASWFLGGNGTSGGFYGNVDGGTLKIEATQPVAGAFTALTPTVNSAIDWADRAMVYGPNGGALILNTAPPMSSPTVWYSLGGASSTSTLVVGEPLPYSGDPWAPNVGAASDGTNQFRSPFEVEYGVALGIFQNSTYTYSGSTPNYKWRTGSGDFQLILTNGASAYLEWNALTNGNFIVRGQPGGDSSVIETNATGWTRNVGRLAIRGPHRNGVQYDDASGNYPVGAISRSFCIPQYNGNGMVFHDAVQVWNRDGGERLACDMSFEAGSSVDFCSGRRAQGLDLGHPGNGATIPGPTNLVTIKSGGKLNLNLQLRSQIGEGRTAPRGESAGLRIWSLIDIKDGGELKIYRSQNNAFGLTEVGAGDTGGSSSKAATKCIELFRPITGNGSTASDSRFVVGLPWSPNSGGQKDSWNNNGIDGANFQAFRNSSMGTFPGPNPMVNGSGDYGLRLVGQGAHVTNFLYAARNGSGNANGLALLTGSGGTLTVALTDTTTININNGPTAASAVKLGLDKEGGSAPTYVLGTAASLANFAGLVLKGGTASVNDASSVSMQTLRLAGSATINLGTAAGGAVLNFANSSAVAWAAGTLSIASWNGSLAGGGSDQIKVGTTAGGLTAAQLGQVKWIAPNGGADVVGAIQLATGEIVPPHVDATTIVPPSAPSTYFSATFRGSPGITYSVKATDSLNPAVWTTIATGTGTFTFSDNPDSLTKPQRFYKVVSP